MFRRRAREGWMGPLPAVDGCDCQICRPERSYDEMDRGVIDTVLQHGWQVMSVAEDHECAHPEHTAGFEAAHADDPDPGPPFAYTIGLGHRHGHPEFLMSGLDRGLMHRALNNVAERVMAGRRFAPGDVLENVLGGVPVVLEEVAEEALPETVTWSGWFHRRKPEALMVVWPTTSGLFAWQPGAPPVLDEVQPRAWRVPIVHRGGVAADPPWPFAVPPDLLAFSCTHVVNEGAPVLWAAREADPDRGEDWSLHCGAEGHETEEMRLTHLAHLVRSAPSVRELADLGLEDQAERADPDSPWVRQGPLRSS